MVAVTIRTCTLHGMGACLFVAAAVIIRPSSPPRMAQSSAPNFILSNFSIALVAIDINQLGQHTGSFPHSRLGSARSNVLAFGLRGARTVRVTYFRMAIIAVSIAARMLFVLVSAMPLAIIVRMLTVDNFTTLSTRSLARIAISRSLVIRITVGTGITLGLLTPIPRRERGEVEQADAHHKGQDDRQNAIQYFLHFFTFLSLHFSDAKGPAVGLP